MSKPALRQALPRDAAALDGFLAQYAETSMFLRGNLTSHGIGNRDHRHGTTYWLLERQGIAGVVGCTNGGYLMCQCPEADSAFWQCAADVLAGRRICGFTGVPDQVNAWSDALGLAPQAFAVKETEPLYRLHLDQLLVPDLAGLVLQRPRQGDISFLQDWFAGYTRDTGMVPTGGASSDGAAAVFVANDGARILRRGDVPVAMTSLNARVANIVQIGGVYVPPRLRGQGLGSAVVAAQLTELRAEGTKTAILFAANAPAARAYEQIGFQLIGKYEVALLKKSVVPERKPDVFQT